jgi:arylsulfatase
MDGMSSRRQFLGSLAGASLAPATAAKPNIVVILADDMGYSDIGCFGGEVRTPNLDRLASRGVRFTQFYNTARCCPTRASLMTGLYPHQAGVGHMVDQPKPFPGYKNDLAASSVTIAEALKPAGYRTYMAGKWHVTPVTKSKHNWPRQRGFDRYYGIIHGAASFYDPVTLVRDNDYVEVEGKDYFFTDALGMQAERYIREHNSTDPFFLYTAFTSPHWPMHAIEADIDKYRGRYKGGWDVLREERYRRMVSMGLVDKRWPLTPRDATVPAWADAPNKAWQERRMEVYAAMIDRMDQNIGRILGALEATKQLDNTLILFMSDNGGCAEELGPKAAARHIPLKTRDGRTVLQGNRPELMPGGPETYQSYGIGWANASNTPFRLYKHWVHEGGISTPLVAHWPSRLKKAGSMNAEPGHLIDVMATCLDAAGARYPTERAGVGVTPLEGRSLVPCIEGKRRVPHDSLYWEHEGNRAVREGNWKLVSKYPGEWELFDLKADRSELKNLASAQPAVAQRLAGKYEAWAKRAQVTPWGEVQKAARLPLDQ